MAVTEKPIQQQQVTITSRLRDLLLSREAILFLVLVVAVLLLSTQNVQFAKLDNLLNQGRFLAEIALIALPMTLIIITGGIDLSVGSMVGLTAVMLGYFWMSLHLPLEVAIVGAIVTATVCGFFNGLLIVRLGIPPLIMTLATLALYRGMASGISQNRQARGFPDWFYQLGQGQSVCIGNVCVPNQLWLVVIGIIIVGVILARTPFGRSIYAIGNNELAARFSGIPVDRYKLIIYTLSGFMCGLAGFIYVSRVSTTRSDMATGWELDVIVSVVLGGTSIFGGVGSIAGTVIGLVLIQLLKYGLTLSGVTSDASVVVVGSVLILTILLNNFIQFRRSNA